jgi:Uma2 family endonuclease
MDEILTSPHIITAVEVANWPEEKRQGELVKGEWNLMPLTGWRHGEIVAQVSFLLKLYLREHPIGRLACNDPGAVLSHTPETLRGPDIGFIAMERVPPEGLPEQWWEGGPDLVVEVVSPSQSIAELLEKAQEFLAAGTRLVWVLDPEQQCVLVRTQIERVRVRKTTDTLDGGDVLPGFAARVAELFS